MKIPLLTGNHSSFRLILLIEVSNPKRATTAL